MPSTPNDPRLKLRSELLLEAERIITKERNKSYGEPDEDFQRIAAIANGLGFRMTSGGECRPLVGSDVALFMICLKLSRLAWAPDHQDSWMDIAGYAGCGWETATLEGQRLMEATPETQTAPKVRYLRDITGHGYDSCQVCVNVRENNPELVV